MPAGIYERTLEIRQKISVGNYRGEEASDQSKYIRVHVWVIKKLGQPDTCSHCERSGLSGRFIHWANLSGKYLYDISDWVRLCAKCHKNYDLGNITI